MTSGTLYLDHAATTPTRPVAVAAVRRILELRAGNASSVHSPGREARAALEEARERVAAAIGAEAREIYFTSGGTEADNLAILGRWRATRRGVILSAIEHSAVRRPAAEAAREGAEVTTIGVDSDGVLDVGALEEALSSPAGVVSVMWGNNEVGTIQPVRRIAELCRRQDATFHTDAVQAVGHVPVNVDEAGCDLLSLSAHKFGGPTGVGALYVRRGTDLDPLLGGGGQERGLRSGTANVAGAAGMAAALDEAVADLEMEASRLSGLRDRLQARLVTLPEVQVNAGGAPRLPHVLSIGVNGTPADLLVPSLDMAGLAVSSGSACHSGGGQPSHVLVAMGRNADAVVRFSLGWTTSEADVDRAADLLREVLERVRAAA